MLKSKPSQLKASKTYYAKNKETVIKNRHEYYQTNKEIIKAKARIYYEKKKDAQLALGLPPKIRKTRVAKVKIIE